MYVLFLRCLPGNKPLPSLVWGHRVWSVCRWLILENGMTLKKIEFLLNSKLNLFCTFYCFAQSFLLFLYSSSLCLCVWWTHIACGRSMLTVWATQSHCVWKAVPPCLLWVQAFYCFSSLVKILMLWILILYQTRNPPKSLIVLNHWYWRYLLCAWRPVEKHCLITLHKR